MPAVCFWSCYMIQLSFLSFSDTSLLNIIQCKFWVLSLSTRSFSLIYFLHLSQKQKHKGGRHTHTHTHTGMRVFGFARGLTQDINTAWLSEWRMEMAWRMMSSLSFFHFLRLSYPAVIILHVIHVLSSLFSHFLIHCVSVWEMETLRECLLWPLNHIIRNNSILFYSMLFFYFLTGSVLLYSSLSGSFLFWVFFCYFVPSFFSVNLFYSILFYCYLRIFLFFSILFYSSLFHPVILIVSIYLQII